jgi:hypothetical protein
LVPSAALHLVRLQQSDSAGSETPDAGAASVICNFLDRPTLVTAGFVGTIISTPKSSRM